MKFYWRKLDNQAKIFSLAVNSKYISIFRLSVLLKYPIDKEKLQIATNIALEKYKDFKVKLKIGFFWKYFERNDKPIIIWNEKEYPYKKINTKENNDYLFKISFYENKINIDFFHLLTDGNSGIEFLKLLVYNYIDLTKNNLNTNIKKQCERILDSKDKYLESGKKFLNFKTKNKMAYMLKGKKLKYGETAINHFILNIEDIKQEAKKNQVTISIYLVTLMIYSIYETNFKIFEGKSPIKICVPVDLRKHFKLDTMSNFFSYMIVSCKLKCDSTYSFEDILNIVKEQFENNLDEKELIKTMSTDVTLVNNYFVRIIPLFIKKFFVQLGSLIVKQYSTTTFSNLGVIEVNEEYRNDIMGFLTILSPDWAEKVKIGICSYENKLFFTISSLLKDNEIEKFICKFLKSKNIKFVVEGNDVKNVIS